MMILIVQKTKPTLLRPISIMIIMIMTITTPI